MPTTLTYDTSKSGDGHVKDCGLRAFAAFTGWPVSLAAELFDHHFGSISITGKQMRSIVESRRFSWHRTSRFDDIPDRALVVTRRGFYPVIDGQAVDRIKAPICGYYA